MANTSTDYKFSRQHTQITCEYTNRTDSAQVVRITNIADWHFERSVFPGQTLAFETVPEAVLEVSTGKMASAIVCDRIPCLRLRAAERIRKPQRSAPVVQRSNKRYASVV